MKNNEKEVSSTLVRTCRLLLVIIIIINTVIAADEYKKYVNPPSARTCRDV